MSRKHGKMEVGNTVQGSSDSTNKSTVHLVQDSDEEVSTTAVITAVPTASDEEKLKMSVGPGESPPSGAVSSGESPSDVGDQFDLKACYNSGTPIQVEWDNSSLKKAREGSPKRLPPNVNRPKNNKHY